MRRNMNWIKGRRWDRPCLKRQQWMIIVVVVSVVVAAAAVVDPFYCPI